MLRRKPSELAREEPKLVRQELGLSKQTVQDLLLAAVQKFKDANQTSISAPTRMEVAYDAILFCALALFAALGYRVQSLPGHHKVAIEGLAAEVPLSSSLHDEVLALQDLRHTKYSGFTQASDADLKAALQLAQRVLTETENWFQAKKPELLK